MAKILSDSAGIVIDADFLDGKLQGGVTVASVDINQDIVQFFQKIMALASMTGNNDFDNEVNGYQFIDALKVFNKYYYENYTSGSIDPTLVPAGHLWLSKDGQVQIDDAGNLAAHDITSVTNFIGDNAGKIVLSADVSQNIVVNNGSNTPTSITKIGDGLYDIETTGLGASIISIGNANNTIGTYPCNTYINAGKLRIRITDLAGAAIDSPFSIIAYW